jgi:hypothetical protein
MYDKKGLTLKDIVAKLNDVVNKVPDDTDVYITFRQFDTDYLINEIRLVGLDVATDDDDTKNGCPSCLELISDDTIEQGDVYKAIEDANDDEFVVDYVGAHGDIIDSIISMYGNVK